MNRPIKIPTRQLFVEFNREGGEVLSEWRARFVATLDPTELKGALELVGSWATWKRFKKEWPHFTRKILPEWLEEIEVNLRSSGISNICEASKKDANSAKWLAEGKWKEKKQGRPTKAQIEREAKIEARLDNEHADDIRRVEEVVKRENLH